MKSISRIQHTFSMLTALNAMHFMSSITFHDEAGCQ